jgi:hypothetical protein
MVHCQNFFDVLNENIEQNGKKKNTDWNSKPNSVSIWNTMTVGMKCNKRRKIKSDKTWE